jgi:hypothetical protein
MQSPSQFFDLYRAGLRTFNDTMKTSLEYGERMQARQLQVLKKAVENSSWSSGQLSQVKSIDELVAVQTRIAGAQLEQAMDYWSGVWRTAGDAQMNIMSQMTAQMEEAKGAGTALREAAITQTAKQERKSA